MLDYNTFVASVMTLPVYHVKYLEVRNNLCICKNQKLKGRIIYYTRLNFQFSRSRFMNYKEIVLNLVLYSRKYCTINVFVSLCFDTNYAFFAFKPNLIR